MRNNVSDTDHKLACPPPPSLARGLVAPGKVGQPWFKELVGWLLWPGVTLMVIASLTSFALSWRSVVKAFRGLGGASGPYRHAHGVDASAEGERVDVPSSWFLTSVAVAFLFAVALQIKQACGG